MDAWRERRRAAVHWLPMAGGRRGRCAHWSRDVARDCGLLALAQPPVGRIATDQRRDYIQPRSLADRGAGWRSIVGVAVATQPLAWLVVGGDDLVYKSRRRRHRRHPHLSRRAGRHVVVADCAVGGARMARCSAARTLARRSPGRVWQGMDGGCGRGVAQTVGCREHERVHAACTFSAPCGQDSASST